MGDPDATSAARAFPAASAVAAELGPGPLRHVTVTGSTNADLAAEARRGNRAGAVLVADHQTAGRGRLDRSWDDDPAGALLVSVRLPVGGAANSSTSAAVAVAAVGAAARAAADALVPVRVLSKWPNDLVVVDGPAPGKLGGVLAELVDGAPSVVVVGVGINVEPIVRQGDATSVVECGGDADRDALLCGLLEALAARRERPELVWRELRDHSATLGTEVRVELPGGRLVTGRAESIDDSGRLVVREPDGTSLTVTAGDVVHVRPA